MIHGYFRPYLSMGCFGTQGAFHSSRRLRGKHNRFRRTTFMSGVGESSHAAAAEL